MVLTVSELKKQRKDLRKKEKLKKKLKKKNQANNEEWNQRITKNNLKKFTFKEINQDRIIKDFKNDQDDFSELRKSLDVDLEYLNKAKSIANIPFYNNDNDDIEMYINRTDHIDEPTIVQKQGWPIILNGNDLLIISPTGSGKTLAYLLPGVVNIRKTKGHSMLVLLPTRELAQQVYSVAKTITRMFDHTEPLLLHGGTDVNEEIAAINDSGNNYEDKNVLIISTPGRLLDLYESYHINLTNIVYIVLDECDRMLQMGFQDQLTKITDDIKKFNNPQIVLCSATLDKRLQKFLNDKNEWIKKKQGGLMLRISNIKNQNSNVTISENVEQIIHVCAEHKKPRKLIRFIEKQHKEDIEVDNRRQLRSMLIFCNKIKTVLFVHEFLVRHEITKVASLHGNLKQDQRQQILTNFRAGKIPILIATDVAARGLHIKNLPIVVSYDFPTNIEQYAHRVGRTGRKLNSKSNDETKFVAYSFLTRNLKPLAVDLLTLLKSNNQFIDPQLEELAKEVIADDNDDDDIVIDDDDELDTLGVPFKDGGFLPKVKSGLINSAKEEAAAAIAEKATEKKPESKTSLRKKGMKRTRGKRGGKKHKKKPKKF